MIHKMFIKLNVSYFYLVLKYILSVIFGDNKPMLNPERMKQNQLQTAMLLDAHNSPSTNFPEMEVIVKLK